ncbi:riboflavin kinase-like [Physella acuta]|uniref:riboflavin kinase-like n=1 Tax=Physella acuta TaxID=109671 RepID=UPI0027DC5DA3|nr:riboflavin kinase-like [Physella acuta]XP_059149135.1 riboflavin kinase-like [Physella acuta]
MAEIDSCLPYFAEGTVVAGFGRGSKELGIPTANFPEDVVKHLPETFKCGVYYGLAKLKSRPDVFKMTMSVGWNPYYHNTVKTMETHILHNFEEDFYGDHLQVIVLGYIRDMCDFKSLDALISAIRNDITESTTRLDNPELLAFKTHPFFSTSPLTVKKPVDSSKVIHTEACDPGVTLLQRGPSVDLAKTIPNGSLNGSADCCEEKKICITNLKVKNSASCEDEGSCGPDRGAGLVGKGMSDSFCNGLSAL